MFGGGVNGQGNLVFAPSEYGWIMKELSSTYYIQWCNEDQVYYIYRDLDEDINARPEQVGHIDLVWEDSEEIPEQVMEEFHHALRGIEVFHSRKKL